MAVSFQFTMVRNTDTRPNFIAWYRDVFGFSVRVATALNDEQLFKDASTIAEFGDSKIDSFCCTLRRDSGLPIAELAVTRLKLLTFWIRHQACTGHEIGGTSNPLVRTKLVTLNLLKEQKRLKDGWAANNKEPEYTAVALDLPSAAKAFEKVKTILTRMTGSHPSWSTVLHFLSFLVHCHRPWYWRDSIPAKNGVTC